jgi:mono/diheme cytochrome c family protein
MLLGAFACSEAGSEQRGAELYARHCASCHGAIASTEEVTGRRPDSPDLTRLAARFGSPLRRDELTVFIDGRRAIPAHGTRNMPVWGVELFRGFPRRRPPRPFARARWR